MILKKMANFSPTKKRERGRERERNYNAIYIYFKKIPKLYQFFFCQENCKNCGGGGPKKRPLIFYIYKCTSHSPR
jgi:hypothetical protein